MYPVNITITCEELVAPICRVMLLLMMKIYRGTLLEVHIEQKDLNIYHILEEKMDASC